MSVNGPRVRARRRTMIAVHIGCPSSRQNGAGSAVDCFMRSAWDGSRRFGITGRALVGLEIVVEYGRVRRDLRRMGVCDAMAALARPAEYDNARERTVAFRMGRAV